MIKAILFDMDGVLINSLRTHFHAFNATIEKFGGKRISLDTFHEKFWGTYVEQNAKIVFGDLSRQSLREIVDEYPLQLEKFAEYTNIYHETKRVLLELKKNLKVGLVSSSQSKIVDLLMKYVELDSYFDVVVCGDQVDKPKPAPDGLIKACESLRIKPSEVIYVGDNYLDVTAGKSAGCLTVGITTTTSQQRLKDADIIIDDLAQLLYLAS